MDKAEAGKRGLRQMFVLAVVATLALTGLLTVDDYFTWRALAAEAPDHVPAVPRLEKFAEGKGRDAFLANCASCHGNNLRGDAAKGTPNLTDNAWLYDFGRVSDIERTVLYGIRSGNDNGHNGAEKAVTASVPGGVCPAWTGKLSPAVIRAIAVYLHSASKEAPDAPK